MQETSILLQNAGTWTNFRDIQDGAFLRIAWNFQLPPTLSLSSSSQPPSSRLRGTSCKSSTQACHKPAEKNPLTHSSWSGIGEEGGSRNEPITVLGLVRIRLSFAAARPLLSTPPSRRGPACTKFPVLARNSARCQKRKTSASPRLIPVRLTIKSLG